MIPLTLKKIAEIVGGELHDVTDPEAIVSGFVEFDSRKIAPGGLFVALAGARVDGHDFSAQAVQAGAVAVLAARPVGVPAVVVAPSGKAAGNAEAFSHDDDGSVAAVVDALATLARYVIDVLTEEHGLKVIGITGSAGKTSTKDLIATVMRTAGETVAPPGSFNNEIGHPYTALRCDTETRFLVAELSARGIGHIAHLAEIAPPTFGVELNVGTAHLGEFGSRDNIARAKSELVQALPDADHGGVAILNAEDHFVAGMAKKTDAKVVTFSAEKEHAANGQSSYFASEITLDDVARASFTLNVRTEQGNIVSEPVTLQVFGTHQVSNALAAAAVGVENGLPVKDVARALNSHVTASAHRMDVTTRGDGVVIINDAYNANPDSMRAGIAALAYTAAAHPEARSYAVLGEMSELGDDAVEEHRKLGHVLSRLQIDRLVAVGESEAVTAMATSASDVGLKVWQGSDVDAATDILRDALKPGDVVLVKASNSQGLWRAAQDLLADKI